MSTESREYYRQKNQQGWKTLDPVYRYGLFLIIALLAMMLFSCNTPLEPGTRAFVYLFYDSSRNCTKAEIRKPNNELVSTIDPHGAYEEQIKARLFDYRDKTFRYIQTPQWQIDAVLAGDQNAIPRSCDDWGFDVIEVDIDDGVESEDVRVRLRPPDYWEEAENYKKLPPVLREQVDRFQKIGINLK